MALNRFMQCAAIPSSVELSTFGMGPFESLAETRANADDADGPWLGLTTRATANYVAAVRSRDAVCQKRWEPTATWRIKTGASISDVRVWVGLFERMPNTSSATYAETELAAFRYATGTDGTAYWRTCTCDGSTLSTTTTTVAIATSTVYDLKIVVGTSSVLFYVNGELAATHSSNLPAAATALKAVAMVQTQAASAKTFYFGEVRIGEAAEIQSALSGRYATSATFLTLAGNTATTLPATSNVWTTMGTTGGFCRLYPGGFMSSSLSNRLTVKARRTAGAGTIEFRLYDVTNAAALASITGISSGTSAFYNSTTFSNIPTGDAFVRIEYRTSDGTTTGETDGFSWDAFIPSTL